MKFSHIVMLLGLVAMYACKHSVLGEDNAREALGKALANKLDSVPYKFDNGEPIREKEAARRLAEPLLFKIYGEDKIKDERPYEIYNIDGYWIMRGTLPEDWDGGTFQIIFEAESRKIIQLTHYR